MTACSRLEPCEGVLLERARRLSEQGRGRVHPNPMVGCVIANGGVVVGEGWHARYGGAHAEIVALAEAGNRARGATVYVTLEPCAHHGKTPPCAEALVAAGIDRLVFASRDPGPGGGGARRVAAAGVEVVGPVWSRRRGRAENPAFFHRHENGGKEVGRLPYLALKLAISLDGRIARLPGRRTRITGLRAATETHRLRSGFDAIMVGATTARVDDPRLTVRLSSPGNRMPARVVVDSLAALPPSAAMLSDRSGAPVHVMATCGADPSRTERLREAGAQVHLLPAARPRGVDLGAVLNRCREVGCDSILCEGGGVLASALLADDLVRHAFIFTAPKLLGPDGVPAFPTVHASKWRTAAPPRGFGDDLLQLFEIEAVKESTECLPD